MFVDTPGHAAFTSMRSHGTSATDIVILVVAVDDGVRPQTVEVAKMALEAKCTIVIALNKVDKIPEGDRQAAKQRVLSQLMDIGIAVEEFGGDVFCAEISGKTGDGVDSLLEGLILQADVLELSAPEDGLAEATVLDARYEKGKGVVVDCLVRWGQISVGDPIVVGSSFGNVKSLLNDRNVSVKSAGPSSAVQILGLRSLPGAGQELLTVSSEETAKKISDRRIKVENIRKLQTKEVTSSDIAVRGEIDQAKSAPKAIVISAVDTVGVAGHLTAQEVAIKMIEEQGGVVDKDALDAEVKVREATVNAILKADGIGTLEALQNIVADINSRTNDARVRVVSASIGNIVKSDIELLSTAANPNVFGFNVGLADASIKNIAKRAGVEIVRDSVIYRLEDDMIAKLEQLIPKQKTLISEVCVTNNYVSTRYFIFILS